MRIRRSYVFEAVLSFVKDQFPLSLFFSFSLFFVIFFFQMVYIKYFFAACTDLHVCHREVFPECLGGP